MLGTIYIETTIPSYHVARPSPNVIHRARQRLTREWWDLRRVDYYLCTSQVVLDEAGKGDPEMARKRLELLAGIPLLDLTEEVAELTDDLLLSRIIPAVASRDAAHLAAAAAHQIQFLLTWNCTHIANPHLRERLRSCFLRHRLDLPVICTPADFYCNDPVDDEDQTDP